MYSLNQRLLFALFVVTQVWSLVPHMISCAPLSVIWEFLGVAQETEKKNEL